MFPSRRPRQRAHEDDNDYRVIFKRIQINPSRHNIDIQHCTAEAEFAAKERGEKFNVSEFLCELIRLGIATLVEKQPKFATFTMHAVAKKTNPEVKIPEVRELRRVGDSLIPSIIDYHRKKIGGKNLKSAFYSEIISEPDVYDIWSSVSDLYGELMDPLLDSLVSIQMKKQSSSDRKVREEPENKGDDHISFF